MNVRPIFPFGIDDALLVSRALAVLLLGHDPRDEPLAKVGLVVFQVRVGIKWKQGRGQAILRGNTDTLVDVFEKLA